MVAGSLRTRLLRVERERDRLSIARPADVPRDWGQFAPLTMVPSGGRIVPFNPYPFQVDLIRSIERSPNTIVLKSRQMGVSESVVSWLLLRAITEPGFIAVIYSMTQEDASALASRVQSAALTLGNLCPELDTESKLEVSFRGLGKLLFRPPSSRRSRGIPSASVLFFDEGAFIDNAGDLYSAASPTMSMLGDRARVIVVSTPNGRSGWFYDMWSQPHDAWNKVSLHWRSHPVYGADPDWGEKQRQLRRMPLQEYRREYELDFSASDAEVFSRELLERASRGQWRDGFYDRTYIMGVDPNFSGSDYFTAVVLDITNAPREPISLVAMYREQLKSGPHNVRKVIELIEDYCPIAVAVEQNGGGRVIAEAIQQLNNGARLELVNTGPMSKRTNTDRITYLLEEDLLVLPDDPRVMSDMQAFRQDAKGKRSAAPGYNDDVPMALAHAFTLLPQLIGWDTSWFAAA